MIKVISLARELKVPIEHVVHAAKVARIPIPANSQEDFELYPGQELKIRELLKRSTSPSDNTAEPVGIPPLSKPEIPEYVTRSTGIVLKTAGSVRKVMIHSDVLEYLAHIGRGSAVSRNISRALLQLQAWGTTIRFKTVKGKGAGWYRTGLGGSGGNQFYLWWKKILRDGSSPADKVQIVVRAVRHHDATDQPLDIDDDYHELPVTDIIDGSKDLQPAFTPEQIRIATSDRRARIIKGHPGTGKTIALQKYVLQAGVAHTLYVTKSELLASRAKEFFDNTKWIGSDMLALSWTQLLARLMKVQQGSVPASWRREQVRTCLDKLNDRELGVWRSSREALLDEIHAFLVGRCWMPHVTDPRSATFPLDARSYKQLRSQKRFGSLRKSAEQAARVIESLYNVIRDAVAESREACAFRIACKLLDVATREQAEAFIKEFLPWRPHAIVVDEIQDLLPIEYAVLVEMARIAHIADADKGTELVLAGDEGQTVGNSAFDFGELSDLVQSRFTTPSQESLSENLRSPSQISGLISAATDLYEHIEKGHRPKGRNADEENDPVRGEVLVCEGWRDPTATKELLEFVTEESGGGFVLVAPDDQESRKALEKHAELATPEILSELVSTSSAKGLDWPTAVVVAPSRLCQVLRKEDGPKDEVKALMRRRMIDGLRVAISRASERLVLLEVDGESSCDLFLEMLKEGESWSAYRGDASDILDHLKRDHELSPEEHVQALLEEAEKWLSSDDLTRARNKATRAVHRLGRPDIPGGVAHLELRRRALKVYGFTELKFYIQQHPQTQGDIKKSLEKAANSLRSAGCNELADAVESLHSAIHAHQPEKRMDALKEVSKGVSSSETEFAQTLREQCAACFSRLIDERNDRDWKHKAPNAEMIQVFKSIEDRLLAVGEQNAKEQAEKAILRWAIIHLNNKRFSDALGWFTEHPSDTRVYRAKCYEGLSQWDTAARLYEEINCPRDALRCWREHGSIDDALRVAKDISDSDSIAILSWLKKIVIEDLPSARSIPTKEKLTSKERELLAEHINVLREIEQRR